MKYPRYEKLGRIRRYWQEVRGMRALQCETELWEILEPVCRSSPSTGCTFHELHVLYQHILRERPAHVLELGAGISTIVMAYAVKKCCDAGHPSKLVSMEEDAYYYGELCKSIPESLRPHVELVLSPTEDREVDGYVARCYKEKPERPYELVFIDGPQIPSHKVDPRYLDGDVGDVRRWNPDAFVAYLDSRRGTREKIAKLFPEARIRYDRLHKLARIDFPAA